MPLITIVGIPSSGKTTLASILEEHFLKLDQPVVCLHELLDYTTITSKTEQISRSSLKSQVEKVLDGNTIVVVDGLNYIKGFRYELFCIAKAQSTTKCTIYIDMTVDTAKAWHGESAKYPSTIIDAIANRMEQPNGKNRWDEPLFRITTDQMTQRAYPLKDIEDAILHGKKPKAGLSTQPAKTGESNFVHALDTITNEIIEVWMKEQRHSVEGNDILIPGIDESIRYYRKISILQARRLRRQFMKIAQLNPTPIDTIGRAFVQYINHIQTNE